MAVTTQRTTELVPVMRERLADLETPVSAFAKLRALGGAFLLESAEGGERMGRFSFIGVAPRETLYFRDGEVSINTWTNPDRDPRGAGWLAAYPAADPIVALREHMRGYRRAPQTGLPRFSGGAVGFVSYEVARRFERLPLARNDPYAPWGLPEMVFGIYDTVVAFDHLRHTLTVLAHDDATESGNAGRMIDRVFAALDAPLPSLATAAQRETTVTANGTSEDYMERVRRARELIAEGDCIQIVLAQRFDVRPAPDALALYRALRHVNPSPYMFLIDTPPATLVGASPEPFVRVENGRVVMHPIAGTRPRGADDAEDAANELALRRSEKERAEHVMLVDLARNDIGRVSRPGTVKVKELMRVDRFSHVMHLTSVVEGELADGLDALDAFRACFPAGTVSGAPKIRAMERIAELEEDQRGPYAGAVGYLGFDGQMDTCITIRTATITKSAQLGDRGAQAVCRIEAGAGIVADSDPQAEEEETRAKAKALLRAIEIANGGTLA
ncbi:MAG: anthranilate synthase component I family protein [Chloroflexi bacterium]|nr:MAG: anthranilate synthase component I family protein [Chloroflexota bacterium]TMC30018.1 MAG: anthranilate synthase component I family protein [Chloroflexota bacterium]TMC37011.1 MAG: anthranilate synthase component I family protein [Chloroflexota bacterium]TMC55518.1 MAG: anthranilate synthase component I family protein [Chloroflexota bacterium]TME38920.1 MAG: anthranilate synthase component I family protein [Chloroflexota bacterium]